MENGLKFPVITACGHAAKVLLFEIASPSKETRNKRIFREYFYKYECPGKFIYKDIQYPFVLRLVNMNEPQQHNELRIIENPKLTRRCFRIRRHNLIEVNPRLITEKDRCFYLSCMILAHAVHGRAFFPSPTGEVKRKKNQKRLQM